MPEQAETKPQLIFDWSKPRTQTARLVFWLLVTGVGVALFFVLFRVVYQTPRHVIPSTQHITLLSNNDPAARNLLQRVADRDFYIFPSNGQGQHQMSLSEQAPVFHPSFEKHELKLQDLPQRDTKPPPARLLDFTEPILPPVDLHELRAPAATPPSTASKAPLKLALHLSGTLETRKLLATPDLSTLPTLDFTAWRFQVGVGSDGRVTFVLPVATGEKTTDVTPMLRVLNNLRFAADDKAESPQWGVASFAWSQPAAP